MPSSSSSNSAVAAAAGGAGHPLIHQPVPHEAPRIHFLNSLTHTPVPSALLRGIEVLLVSANGSTQPAILRLTEDKFTLCIRPIQVNSSGRFFGLLGGGGNSGTSVVGGRQQLADLADRAIDIGEMDRIQRGQSTQHFELAKKKAGNTTAFNSMTIDGMNGNASSSFIHNGTDRYMNHSSHGSIGTGGTMKKIDLKRNSSTDSAKFHAFHHGGPPPSPSHGSSSQHSMSSISSQGQPVLDSRRSFSIIFRGAHTLDLMASSWATRNEICDALDRVLLAYQRGKIRVAHDVLLLRYIWLDVDKNKTGYIQQNQIAKVLQQINFQMKGRDLQAAYDLFGKVIGLDRAKRKRGLTFEQSLTFLHKIKRDSWMVKPISVIWNELFGELMKNGKMRTTVSETTFLEKFLQGKQRQVNATLLDVRKLFRRLHDMEIAHTSSSEPMDLSRISKDHFEAYLLTAENDAFDPARESSESTDMNQPLSEYWINSSHNTYLIGDQYTSQSSVEMYSNALYRGCRCLELDIWDGPKSPNPVPVVWHGNTMTTRIRFDDIIQTIKVFLNFHRDTYPIILSFENHCSLPYQEVMADALLRILGDSLYIPTEQSLNGSLPSPAQLRGMVVIKGRRPDGTDADAYDTDDDDSIEDGTNGDGETSLQQSTTTSGTKSGKSAVVKHGVAPQLARLTLLHGHKHKSFDESARTRTYFMHSFSENKLRNKCRHKQAAKWIAYNQTHMSRVYPAGSRVDSSNYNPLLAWSMGCQMVALNFQTQDAFLRLNDGRFRENGNCGYVIKPSTLMIKDDPYYQQNMTTVRLSIRILSGSCLPKPKGQLSGDCIDPYVRVAVFDVKKDEKESITTFPTNVVPANGFFPIWSGEKFVFMVENWAAAMVQLTVYDKARDEFIASSSIPFSCLRRGIRSVKLYDATNTRSGAFDFATLLLDIKLGQVVAEI